MKEKSQISKELMVYTLTQKGLDERAISAEAGNLQAKLDLILHNQGILNEKLNNLLQEK